jgi:hypothetical protein
VQYFDVGNPPKQDVLTTKPTGNESAFEARVIEGIAMPFAITIAAPPTGR